MRQERSDGLFILTIILLFGVSVKLLPTKDKKPSDAKINPAEASAFFLNESPLDQAIIYLRPLIASHSAGTLAQALQNVNLERVIELADDIVDKEALTHDQKLLFLFALTFNYQDNSKAQFRILDRIIKYDQLQKGTPILLIAAHSDDFRGVIPTVLRWAHNKKNEKQFIERALAGAIEENDVAALKTLVRYKMPITKEQASQSLFKVVQQNKDPALVPFFVEHGADVNSAYKKRIPLIYATENNNKALVEALLKAGAKPEMFVDPEVGTALQIAIEKRYADIDVLLRTYGAREN
jgi:Ankyrin repeats (3 copies)